MSFKEYLGYEGEILPKLATGFGGGIGRKGSICGALTGSIMMIGMKWGRTDPKDRETVSKVHEKCRQFWDQFEKEFGSVNCYNLTGCDFTKEEERKRWQASGGNEKCTAIVERTAKILFDFIEEK